MLTEFSELALTTRPNLASVHISGEFILLRVRQSAQARKHCLEAATLFFLAKILEMKEK